MFKSRELEKLFETQDREKTEREIKEILESPRGEILWLESKQLLKQIKSLYWKDKENSRPSLDTRIEFSPSYKTITQATYDPVTDDQLKELLGIPKESHNIRLTVFSPRTDYPSMILTHNQGRILFEQKLRYYLRGSNCHFTFSPGGHSPEYTISGNLGKCTATSLSYRNQQYCSPDPQEIVQQLETGLKPFKPMVSQFVEIINTAAQENFPKTPHKRITPVPQKTASFSVARAFYMRYLR